MTNIMIKYNYFLKLDYFKSSVVYVLKRTTFLKLFVNLFLSIKTKDLLRHSSVGKKIRNEMEKVF